MAWDRNPATHRPVFSRVVGYVAAKSCKVASAAEVIIAVGHAALLMSEEGPARRQSKSNTTKGNMIYSTIAQSSTNSLVGDTLVRG